MKLIKKEFIETNEGILKKTYLMLPLKKKSIKNRNNSFFIILTDYRLRFKAMRSVIVAGNSLS